MVGGFVIAGIAAGLAIHEAVRAHADIKLRLAEAAELIALTLAFRHFALAATILAVGGSRVHIGNVAPLANDGNVPLVTHQTRGRITIDADAFSRAL